MKDAAHLHQEWPSRVRRSMRISILASPRTESPCPWIVAADVCQILEIRQSERAPEQLDPDDVATASIPGPDGIERTTIIRLCAVYQLAHPTMPVQQRLWRWVCRDALAAY